MTVDQIQEMFEALGLGSPEERQRFIDMGGKEDWPPRTEKAEIILTRGTSGNGSQRLVGGQEHAKLEPDPN